MAKRTHNLRKIPRQSKYRNRELIKKLLTDYINDLSMKYNKDTVEDVLYEYFTKPITEDSIKDSINIEDTDDEYEEELEPTTDDEDFIDDSDKVITLKHGYISNIINKMYRGIKLNNNEE